MLRFMVNWGLAFPCCLVQRNVLSAREGVSAIQQEPLRAEEKHLERKLIRLAFLGNQSKEPDRAQRMKVCNNEILPFVLMSDSGKEDSWRELF